MRHRITWNQSIYTDISPIIVAYTMSIVNKLLIWAFCLSYSSNNLTFSSFFFITVIYRWFIEKWVFIVIRMHIDVETIAISRWNFDKFGLRLLFLLVLFLSFQVGVYFLYGGQITQSIFFFVNTWVSLF